MTTLIRKRIRLKIEADKFANAQDVRTSNTPKLYRGNDAQFELCMFWNDAIIDMSNVASLTLGIYDTNRSTLRASKTIDAADITASPTADGWTAGTAQHAVLAFTGAELNWALPAGKLTEKYHLVVSGVTTDDPGHDITYGISVFELEEDAAGTAGTPPVNDPLYYTQPESDARFQQKHADGASIQFVDGKHAYIYCPDDALWYPLVVTLKDGQAALGLGAGETL